MEGLKIACLYSLGCPELKRMKAQELIFDFIKNPRPEKIPQVKEILEKLDPFLFYQVIGLQNGISDFFEEEVVRAYWLGNDFLRPTTKKDIESLLVQQINFRSHQPHLRKLLDLVGRKPHHNFETLWAIKRIRRDQKLLPGFLENLYNCLVRPGQVVYVGKWIFEVETRLIAFKGGEITLEDSREIIHRQFVKNIKKGDFVSIHLWNAREKIQKETAENLLKITEEAISFFQKG